MSAMQWMAVGSAVFASVAIGAGAGRWWYGRRVVEMTQRLDKAEKARQVAGQHAAQARRQVEQLQKDLAAQHKARSEERTARKRELSESLDAAEARPAPPAAIVFSAAYEQPELPAHGFADTMPIA